MVKRIPGAILSHLTLFLRWAAEQVPLDTVAELTPALWFDYVDARPAAGRKPTTLNGELSCLQHFLQFLADQGRAVCPRTLRLEPLKQGDALPRDVPLDQLRRLQQEVEAEGGRAGALDRAWFLLMLHCGLRTGEVRRLWLTDLDLAAQRVRVTQSKGLKDRVVCLSAVAVAALEDYLAVRGPAPTDHVFTYRHRPLSATYCHGRLRTYGQRCGVRVTPHQLRHSCATLLLNAGAPILAVQAILGHEHIDTTLAYARLYDRTVVADYYRAMSEVEGRMEMGESADVPPGSGELLALVDALSSGTLDDAQREMVQAAACQAQRGGRRSWRWERGRNSGKRRGCGQGGYHTRQGATLRCAPSCPPCPQPDDDDGFVGVVYLTRQNDERAAAVAVAVGQTRSDHEIGWVAQRIKVRPLPSGHTPLLRAAYFLCGLVIS